MDDANDVQSLDQQVRLAILYGVVNALGDAGKTRLQKTIYFLQEAFGVPSSYAFKMHHYGPYSDDLDTDMTRLKMTGYLSITPDLQGYGFHVEIADVPEENWDLATGPYKEKVEQALSLVRDKTPSELELMATLHFVDRLLGNPANQALIETVRGLKPKFSPEYIDGWRKQLTDANLL